MTSLTNPPTYTKQDELAFAAPKRSQDLHPSNTYQGDGDEVDESEWD